jgi:hypothetical protein
MKRLYRLSDRAIKTTLPGKYHDGAGLYLIVAQGTLGLTRNWSFRYTAGDRQRWHGLGSYPLTSLAEARRRAQDAHELLARGEGPDRTQSHRTSRASSATGLQSDDLPRMR